MRKKYNYRRFSSVALTRKKLGLSQRQFAADLGIPYGTLSMVELGKRELPIKALLKLGNIELSMYGAGNQDSPMQQEDVGHKVSINKEGIEHRGHRCGKQHAKSIEKLRLMQERHADLTVKIGNIEKVLSASNSNGHVVNTASLIAHRNRLLSQLERCSLQVQSKLQTNIELLSAALAVHNSNSS